MMSEAHVYPVPPEFAAKALVNAEKYEAMYAASVADPEAFWREHGKRLRWMRPYTKVKNVNWDVSKTNDPKDLFVKWFEDGTLNVSVNCIDRHLPAKADTTAFIFEGDDPSVSKHITYGELHSHVCRFANVLKEQGVRKGDRVTIYMPMIPEAAYAMLACARIGAIHSVVFGGFSPDSLAGRIEDCGSTCIVTADEGVRGGKPIPLKANVDASLDRLGAKSTVTSVITIKRTGGKIDMQPGRDHWYEDLAAKVSGDCEPEEMSAEDPLFILYTSGSTGKPKGVLHTTGGYLVWASMTHEIVFDYKPGDVFW
jgi:acetyl-CoA synthetase